MHEACSVIHAYADNTIPMDCDGDLDQETVLEDESTTGTLEIEGSSLYALIKMSLLAIKCMQTQWTVMHGDQRVDIRQKLLEEKFKSLASEEFFDDGKLWIIIYRYKIIRISRTELADCHKVV